MRFNVTAHVTIEAPTADKALDSARAIQKLLDDPMVRTILQSNGIDVRQIQVFAPQSVSRQT